MTLCIAAVARDTKGNHYVTVSDYMLSTRAMSAEPSLTKTSFIGKMKRWAVMYAGDPTCAWSIINRVINKTEGLNETFERMTEAFKEAYKEELDLKINDEILNPIGMTLAQFTKQGKEHLGREKFGELFNEIRNTSLDTTLLVGNTARIFSVHDPGRVTYHDTLAFHAIGTGATLATASLMGAIDSTDPFMDIAYRLLEAKFRGESASGVGKDTFLTIMDGAGQTQFMPPEKCEEIRKLWEKKGKPPIPKKSQTIIKKSLMPLKGLPVAN